MKYPFSQKGERRIRIRGTRRKKERAYLEIKKLIDKGTTSTSELASKLGTSTRQTRRHIKNMASLGLIKLDPQTGMLVKKRPTHAELLSRDRFTKIPEIEKWINDCIARDVQPSTISQYMHGLKSMLILTKTTPKDIIKSKKDALEIWAKFMVEFRKQNAKKGTQRYRVSFKNFLASFEITFAPRMGKMYGLSSAHDKHGGYAGVSLSQELTKKIGDMILADGDLQLYTWWRIGLRTGARTKAISTMVWERVYFDEKNEDGSQSFKLEQHETKDARGHYHLGQSGEWKTKYPPLDLRELLLRWKKQVF